MNKYWEIAEGKVDSAKFFNAITECFPEATTLYIEGTVIEEGVEACYVSHQEAGEYLPSAQTIIPYFKQVSM